VRLQPRVRAHADRADAGHAQPAVQLQGEQAPPPEQTNRSSLAELAYLESALSARFRH
jgi:hypothetical protein